MFQFQSFWGCLGSEFATYRAFPGGPEVLSSQSPGVLGLAVPGLDPTFLPYLLVSHFFKINYLPYLSNVWHCVQFFIRTELIKAKAEMWVKS